MPDADLIGQASLNGNPPFITIYLSVQDDKVKRAAFDAHGCGVTTALCSVTTELVVGKSIAECRLLTIDQVCAAVDGVPPDKNHCAHVCLKALLNAVNSGSDHDERH